MKSSKIKNWFTFACATVSVLCWGDATVTLTGNPATVEYTFKTDTTVNLNGVTIADRTLKFTSYNNDAPVTVTLNLVEGTQNTFTMDNDNKELIKATKKTSLIIAGAGAMTLTSTKRITDGTDETTGEKIPSAVVVCNNLTVNGGDTKVVYDSDKPDTYCVLVKGNYLQTGGKFKVDASKKNKDTEFVGLRMDTKSTTFTLEGGKFNAEIAGTNSRAIDLRGSCTATFEDGDVKCEFEGPGTRFVNDGTIVFNGGVYEFITNITAKMTSAYYPTNAIAVKTDKTITINGGDFEADLPLVGSEIFKTTDPGDGSNAAIRITAGELDLVAGNDCISANGDIVISGGHIRATSVYDDALDANANLTISGGDIRAYATAIDTHGMDVNSGKVSGVKKTLTISGGIVVATDGPSTHKIGDNYTDVGKKSFTQATYYGTLAFAGYAGKYLTLSGTTNGVPFTIKPRLPANFATTGDGKFNLLVSVPGRSASLPAAQTAAQAFADANSRTPLVFERKATVAGHTVTTKFGEVLTIPEYYDLTPSEGAAKTITLQLNSQAAPSIKSAEAKGANFNVGVQTLSGLRYQLVTADSPSAPSANWSTVGAAKTGDGKDLSLPAPMAGNAGFFRVRVSD